MAKKIIGMEQLSSKIAKKKMPEVKEKKPDRRNETARTTFSFRLSEDAAKRLEELYFDAGIKGHKKTKSEILEEAIMLLYEKKKGSSQNPMDILEKALSDAYEALGMIKKFES